MTVGGIIVPIGANIKNLVSNTRKAAAAIRQMQTKGGRSLAKLEKRFQKAKTAALSLKNAAGLLAAGLAFKEITTAGLQMEKMTAKVKAATGTAHAAAIEMEFLNHQVDRLGLELRTAGDDFGQLAASAKGTTLAGQGTRDIFTAVAEAASVLKLSADDTSGAIRAISQMMSKGKVQAEELRGQLGERLPGAFGIAARAMGKTTQELDKMLEQGEVIAEDFLPKFAREMQKTFADQVPDAVQSAQASINRFNNTVFRMKADIAAGGILDGLTTTLDFLRTDVIPGVQASLTVLTGNFLTFYEGVRKNARLTAAFIDKFSFTVDIDPDGMLASVGRFTGFMSDIKEPAKTYEQQLKDINAEYALMIKSINDITTEGVMKAFGEAKGPLAAPIVEDTFAPKVTGLTQEQIDKNIADAQNIKDIWMNVGDEKIAADKRAADMMIENEERILAATKKAAEIKKMLAWSIAGNAIAAARALFGDSKALIIAGIVLEKANALAKNAVWTAEGATAAAAAAAPLGPAASAAAALKMKTLGGLNAALIVATGLGQAATAATGSGGSGGSVGGGSAAATQIAPSSALTEDITQQAPQVVMNITIDGDVIDTKEFFQRNASDIKDLAQQGINFGFEPLPE